MNPFMVQIFKAYKSPIAPDQAAVIVNIMHNIANVSFVCLIRFTGKRLLFLIMLSLMFACSAIISGYGFAVLPSGYNSFDHSLTFSIDNEQLAYIPFVLIILWTFCTYCSVHSMAFQFVSEVFPFK